MSSRARVRFAFALAFVSGFAALTHELLWTRRLIDLLGASTESAGRDFGFFFLGLALGAAVAARRLERVARPWRALALAEAGVALFAVPMLLLPRWSDWIWPAVGLEHLMGWPGLAVKTALSAAVLLPPAFCMGLALPFLSHGLLRWTHRLDTDGVRLYAVNTLGGAVGLLAAILYLLPLLGAVSSMLCAMVLNAAVAAGALLLDRTAAVTLVGEEPRAGGVAGKARPIPPALLLVACFSGFGILAAEVIGNQLCMLVATLSFYAPATILFAVISSLAAGAFLAPRLRRRTASWPFPVLLAAALGAAALCLAAGPLIFMGIVEHVNVLGANRSVDEFVVKLALLAFVALGPGFLLGGLVFPLAMAWAAEAQGDPDGRQFGWLLAVNGLGGLLGAETAYRVLLPVFDVHTALGMVALGYALAGLALAGSGSRPVPWRAAHAGPTLGVALLVLLGLRPLPLVNTHHGLAILDHRSGREGSVAVVESEALGRCLLVDNQYLLGGSQARAEEERQAHLALLLHGAPREVAFIGLATGITPGAALLHSNLNSITVVELSPLVERAADRFFTPFNHGITRSRRAKVVIDDGRTLMAASPGRFDVVIGDLFLPWAPGEGRLYSLEHFRNVRRSLRPHGLFCQWLAMYQFTPRQFELLADTFQAVFPRTYLFANTLDSREPALALVGFSDDTELDWQTVRARCAELQQQGLADTAWPRDAEDLAELYLGQWRAPTASQGAVALNTLDNLLLELDAGRERLTGRPGAKYFYGSRWVRFCHDRRSELLAQGLPAHSPLTAAALESADRRMQEGYAELRNSSVAKSSNLSGPGADATKQAMAPVPR